MMYKPNRNHFLYVIKESNKLIRSTIVFILIIVAKFFKDTSISTIFIITIGIIGLEFILVIVEWKKYIFYTKDNMLVLKKGVISKISEEIPFDKVNTIDSTQSIFDRIFKVYTLKIDTGNNDLAKSEFIVIVNKKVKDELKNTVLNLKDSNLKQISNENLEYTIDEKENEEVLNRITITEGEIFKYAITKSKVVLVMGLLGIIFKFNDNIEKYLNFKVFKSIEKYVNTDFIQFKSIFSIISTVMISIILIYIVLSIVSIIFEFVRLNKFTVETFKDKISISYGLFTKKNYSFKLEKIRGVRYKQTILQQLMNVSVVELITIGYGDEKNEKAILYPIVDEKLKNSFIKNVLPNMIFEGEKIEPPKSSIKRFYLRSIIKWSIILIPLNIFFRSIPINIKLAITIFVVVFTIITSLLSCKNTSLGIDNNVLLASNGWFEKVTTIVTRDNIQSITKKQSIFQKKLGICTYETSIYSNELGDTINTRYVSALFYNKIQNNLQI